MLKTYKYILSAILMCSLWACEGTDEIDFFISKYFVDVTKTVTIGAEKDNTAKIDVEADCSWTIEGLPDWLSANPTSGSGNQEVTLTCTKANTDPTNKRSAEITLKADNGKLIQKIEVVQEQGGTTVSFDNPISFNGYAESKVQTLICNSDWTITPSVNWITVSPAAGETTDGTPITLSVTKNEGSEARSGKLTIQPKNGKAVEITINQKVYEATLTLESDDLTIAGNNATLKEFTRDGGQSYIVLQSSDNWHIEGIDQLPQGWLTITPTNGTSGVTQMLVTAGKNNGGPLSGQITIQNDANLYKVLKFSQQSAEYYLDLLGSNEYDFSAIGGEAVISVRSSSAISVSGLPSWIKLIKTEAKGNNLYEITLEASANMTPDPRTPATIIISNQNSNTVTVKATQKAFELFLNIDKESVSFGSTADKATIVVTSNAEWEAISNEDWCKVTVSDVTQAGGKVNIEVTTNERENSRKATVSVRLKAYPMYTKTCIVEQSAGSGVEFYDLRITDTTKNSFTFSGVYHSETRIEELSVCINDTGNPTAGDTIEPMHLRVEGNSFTCNFEGLQSAHKYYVRAYARNAVGTYYSQVLEVTTGGSAPNESDNNPPSTH